MRILALDIGSKTIGVAVSDPFGWTAQGLTTIKRHSLPQDLAAVCGFIHEYEAEEVLIGLPLNMNGSRGPAAFMAEEFGAQLTKAAQAEGLAVKLTMRDERLTTVAAQRVLLEGDVSRRSRKKVVDKLAAVLILQGYLDYRR
ncbi:MAG: Holliday junction resolvase RuvX [Clostridiales bacterium]|nr:Holliday junction resolvase RuvX [Clostridiales bacterium]